ncbi:AraC family transcriptional regulator [Paenibacillus glucanolyticus]|jgi:AraC-like DNA-binding protein/mannose-6-phosphate isomerase-like protein (cupin superfamily)|uniref:AraC family transcriptional regulator n=1 Tax=Paenibacillus TaxID=44249 RepID=UPI0003E288DD|nr:MULTISPECIES: AraC family transcriptional regulator [Paenibacillus]ANA78543.1 AraC family transcriptional regulator [Paenibacillus glucanolyticus]AVV57540.1 AraC family transcriptional regulator [Paenibacillus glucanolyticus]ETT34978.1 AraC family transcriptional regulator [Paenibacillus sp. FSL R5-808]
MDTLRKPDGFQSQKIIVLPDRIMQEAARHPLVQPLHVTDIGYFPRALHHYRERPEGSGAYIVMYCVEGEGWCRMNGHKVVRLLKGQVVVIPPGTPHAYASSEQHPWSIYWWHMKGQSAGDYYEGFSDAAEPAVIPVDQSRRMVELFQESYDLLQKGYTLNHIIHVSQLAGHLAAIIRLARLQPQHGLQLPHKHDLDETLRFMTEHLERNVSLKELAAYANLSVPHFTFRFKEATGYSPIDYYLRLKIQLACQHLDLTGQSIKEISHRLGFQDPYYFSRLFKKIMGKSPSDYRDTRKG